MCRCEKERNTEFTSPYATSADFCRIFQEDVRPLFLLCFLLTANYATAERCYVQGIENVVKGNAVFKGWARSWSRRTVIQNAIRFVLHEPIRSEARDAWHDPRHKSWVGVVINCVTRLAPLQRFVFVMSVLERYSDRECSLLLNCTVQDVIEARLQALQTFAAFDPPLTEDVGQQSEQQPLLCKRV